MMNVEQTKTTVRLRYAPVPIPEGNVRDRKLVRVRPGSIEVAMQGRYPTLAHLARVAHLGASTVRSANRGEPVTKPVIQRIEDALNGQEPEVPRPLVVRKSPAVVVPVTWENGEDKPSTEAVNPTPEVAPMMTVRQAVVVALRLIADAIEETK